MTSLTEIHIATNERYGAHNYSPLPVVLEEGSGSWVKDVEGRWYLDMLAAYSALNFGHRHPTLVDALQRQLGRLTLTSRAFHNDQLGAFCEELAALVGMDRVLPMNTGAEAVETAIKAARKWGYEAKGVGADRAEIIVCEGNFHGRTTSLVSFSSDATARDGFGPFTPGFVSIPYGDPAALESTINESTVAFLFEPIQGERGVVIPPDGYLQAVREICTRHEVLLLADEIQSGLGRTGTTLACDHEGVLPDVLMLGKALGGGLLPVSAVVGRADVMGVFGPGTHGSTFGGNPLACAVARAVIGLLAEGDVQARALSGEARLVQALENLRCAAITDIRCKGLWAGLDIHPDAGGARAICEDLAGHGVLTKETQVNTLRLAPPLVTSDEDLDWAMGQLDAVIPDA